jgi:hypothetical protein
MLLPSSCSHILVVLVVVGVSNVDVVVVVIVIVVIIIVVVLVVVDVVGSINNGVDEREDESLRHSLHKPFVTHGPAQ